MNFKLFIDESGDHGLINLDPQFPVFLLCGILCNEDAYENIRTEFNRIKMEFWQSPHVIFHSRDIRKMDKEFKILFDLAIKQRFYEQLDQVISSSKYRIIASAIDKAKYINTYGRLSNDVYELALSFIIERAVFSLDEVVSPDKRLEVVIEKRGRKENKQLEEHFQRLLSRGTSFVTAERLHELSPKIMFRDKRENINGLQLADLTAYPIARYVIEPKRVNLSFDILKEKIYTRKGKRYGLKIFP